MIIVTGAAGFIGSCLVARLNADGYEDLLLVDDFTAINKIANLSDKKFSEKVERDNLFAWLALNVKKVDFVFHIGARTDTTEFDKEVFDKLNVNYSKELWAICTSHQIPFVYASSAATYGCGENGYSDDHHLIPALKPLNPYGWSKQEFDAWVLQQEFTPPSWQGLKFFNVYGPNEYHKNRMASVIFHAANQIKANGTVKLFRSHHADYRDGWQLRDFVYVKDVIEVCMFLMENQVADGIYNLGTGKARSFYDLAIATFNAMQVTPAITYIDIPVDIRDKYQYYTEAEMNKLIRAGYDLPFHSLEEGISDYLKNYLLKEQYY